MTSHPPRRGSRPAMPDAAAPDPDPALGLPPWKAFIVQFRHTPAGSRRAFSGRVEHLHSGRRVDFESQEDLVTALERILDKVEGRGGG